VHPHRHDVNVGSSLTGPTGILPTFTTSYNSNNNNNNGSTNNGSIQPNGTTNFINNQGYYIPRQYVRTFPGAKRTNAPLGLNSIGGITGISGVSGVNKQLAASEAWSKPRLVTVIKAGEKPRKKVSILLNRKAILSFEQFVCDISDAFGLPQWKNDKIRKLYTLKGRRVQGVSDFFRDDNVFIAVSGKELLTTHMVKDLLEDLYPDSSYSQSLLKEWEKSRRLPNNNNNNNNLDSSIMNKSIQRDSGFGEEDGLTDRQQVDVRRFKDLNDSKDSRDSRLINEDAMNKKKSIYRFNYFSLIITICFCLEKKKKETQEIVIDIESQRQKDRLRLIEEERKKREIIAQPQINTENKDPLNTSITTTTTNYTTTNKNDKPSINKPTTQQQNDTLPLIVQPSSQQNLSTQELINKKLKRKSKARKSQGQSEDESNYKNMNVTPSGVKPVINDDSINNGKPLQQINTNTVTLPKIGGQETGAHDTKHVKEKNREKHDIHALRKLKRQISNAKHVTDRYEILKTLGDGNFAVVKQAKLRSTDNEYAIKIIDKSKMKVLKSSIKVSFKKEFFK
jgi:doublecortin-like kinase 3